jgi:dUTP pyrophosphatase
MPKKKSAKTSARKAEEKSQEAELQKVKSEETSAEKKPVSTTDAVSNTIKTAKDTSAPQEGKAVKEFLETKVADLPVKVKKLHEDSKLPVRAHSTDAGIDLFTYEDFTLEMLERKLVGTGVAIQIPEGHVGFIKEKSGLANKGLEVKAGVVDAGFIGEVKVNLKNPKGFAWKDGKRNGVGEKMSFKKGEKIAQMVIIPVNLGEVVEVDELDKSERGESGWGSTGHE